MSKSQPSAAQIEANRQNAKKSTGPKTPQGKARSSQNAIKHGLHSRILVMPDESQADFDELSDGLLRSYGPQNLAEKLIVEQIIIAHWKIRRLQRYERFLFDRLHTRDLRREREIRKDKNFDFPMDSIDVMSRQFGSVEMEHLQYLEDRLQYSIVRAHRELVRLRKLARDAREDEWENEADLEVSDEEAEAYGEEGELLSVADPGRGDASTGLREDSSGKGADPEVHLRL